MLTAFSPVGVGRASFADGFGDGDGDGSAHPAGAITFSLVPLLGGFCGRLNTSGAAWLEGYGAREIILTCFEAESTADALRFNLYQLESGQNLTFQKTVLGLGVLRPILARFVLLGDNGAPVFISALKGVETLN
jgi:hypothetical protein